MLELEVKILNMDLDLLEEKLKGLGAKYLGEEEQINRVFDGELGQIESRDAYLRIRQTQDKNSQKSSITMTYKESLPSELLRENREYDVRIDNLKEMENLVEILGFLGYTLKSTGYKNRKSYEFENIRFDLDRWDEKTYPYPYMEIEVEREEDLEKALKLLDIPRSNISTKSISQLRNEVKA